MLFSAQCNCSLSIIITYSQIILASILGRNSYKMDIHQQKIYYYSLRRLYSDELRNFCPQSLQVNAVLTGARGGTPHSLGLGVCPITIMA